MTEYARRTTKIYIDLDTLLDTRLAILDSIDTSYSNSVIKNPKYFTRRSDDFSKLSNLVKQEKYLQAWNNRDASLIENNVYPTFMNVRIHGIVTEHIIDTGTSPINGDTLIYLNTYPYQVDEKGKAVLKQMIRTNFLSEGTVCYIPTDLLTPKHIKDNYDDVYMYEFDKWLNKHFEELKENPMPQVYIIAPLLMQKETNDRKYDIEKDKEFLEHSLAAHVQLELLPVQNYCIFVRS